MVEQNNTIQDKNWNEMQWNCKENITHMTQKCSSYKPLKGNITRTTQKCSSYKPLKGNITRTTQKCSSYKPFGESVSPSTAELVQFLIKHKVQLLRLISTCLQPVTAENKPENIDHYHVTTTPNHRLMHNYQPGPTFTDIVFRFIIRYVIRSS